MFFSRELPNSELLKKIICLESCQLSYTLVRKNIYSENQTKILNSTISRVKEKYNKDNFLMFDSIKDLQVQQVKLKSLNLMLYLMTIYNLLHAMARKNKEDCKLKRFATTINGLQKNQMLL